MHASVWFALGFLTCLVLLCLVSVMCMPRYLEDIEADRL